MIQENLNSQFVVCVNNLDTEASLEFGKIYRIIPDADAESEGLIRIIDESGEDYGFAASRFYPVQLPVQLEQILSVSH